jgi:hypothetical protein
MTSSISKIVSPFNPIIFLHPSMQEKVDIEFIAPIIHQFFYGKPQNFELLDMEKLKTEVEFQQKGGTESYIKTYLYDELMQNIHKTEDGTVHFKPRYVISFDKDLTDYETRKGIQYGTIRLGNAVVLYIIYIDLQDLIRFMKGV